MDIARKVATTLIMGSAVSACGKTYKINPQSAMDITYVSELYGFNTDGTAYTDPKLVNAVSSFRARALAASAEGASATDVKLYLEAGISVGDHFCGMFFDKNRERKQKRDALRGGITIAGGLSSAILGLANVSNDVVAGSGLGFSGVNAFLENQDIHFLISPEIEKVEALVNDAKTQKYAAIVTDNPPANFYMADRYLRQYIDICDFNTIKRLVGAAVETAKPTLDFDTDAIDQVALQAANVQVDRLSDQLLESATSLSGDDLVYLYTYYFGARSDGVAEALEAVLSAKINKGGQPWETILQNNARDAKQVLRSVEAIFNLEARSKEWIASIAQLITEAEDKDQAAEADDAEAPLGIMALPSNKDALIARLQSGTDIPSVPVQKKKKTTGEVVRIKR